MPFDLTRPAYRGFSRRLCCALRSTTLKSIITYLCCSVQSVIRPTGGADPMATTVLENHYGKSSVRLVKVERNGAQHSVRDLTLDIQLSGEFAAAYRDGDNRLILPTDTMKNTVYAFARRQTLGEIEEFGKRLAAHFLE